MWSSKAWRLAQGLLIAHGIFAAVTWLSLPSRIPVHFGASGKADSWMEASPFLWFTLVVVSLSSYLLIYILSRPEARDLWNIPEKNRFLKLPKEKQAPVVELVQMFGGATAAATGLLFFTLQVGMYLTAMGISEGLPWYVQVTIYAIPIALLFALVLWSRAVKRAVQEAEEDTATVS